MKVLGPILVLIAIIGGGLYYHYSYPPNVLKRHTRQALEQFEVITQTKDRAKLSEAMKGFFTDDATIVLEVGFFSLTQNARNSTQDFTKQSFIQFVDNVLYPMTDFGFEKPELTSFKLSTDGSADIAFTALVWADGASLFGGASVDVRFSANPECTGKVSFDEQKKPHVSQMDCKVVLRQIPKPGQAEKIQKDIEGLKEYLQTQ